MDTLQSNHKINVNELLFYFILNISLVSMQLCCKMDFIFVFFLNLLIFLLFFVDEARDIF